VRRLAGKILLRRFQQGAATGLWPHQLGVGAPGDVDVIVQRCRAWVESADVGQALLKIDPKNAFNCVDRAHMLRCVRERCPPLYPYAMACYGGKGKLQGPGYALWSEEGTQQGCPASPLFFDLAIQATLVLAGNMAGVDLNLWHQDDAQIAGSIEGVAAAFAAICEGARKIRLSVSLPKCAILSKIRPDVVPAVLENIVWVPWDQGLEILGCPVGSAGFVQKQLDKVLIKLESAMARGMSLGDPHSSSLLLRSCLGAGKVKHLLRCLSPPPGSGRFRETRE
jgi:hypothetical protein